MSESFYVYWPFLFSCELFMVGSIFKKPPLRLPSISYRNICIQNNVGAHYYSIILYFLDIAPCRDAWSIGRSVRCFPTSMTCHWVSDACFLKNIWFWFLLTENVPTFVIFSSLTFFLLVTWPRSLTPEV